MVDINIPDKVEKNLTEKQKNRLTKFEDRLNKLGQLPGNLGQTTKKIETRLEENLQNTSKLINSPTTGFAETQLAQIQDNTKTLERIVEDTATRRDRLKKDGELTQKQENIADNIVSDVDRIINRDIAQEVANKAKNSNQEIIDAGDRAVEQNITENRQEQKIQDQRQTREEKLESIVESGASPEKRRAARQQLDALERQEKLENDGKGAVVVTGDPSQGENVQAVGQGETLNQARVDAAQNPDFDADKGQTVDILETRLQTGQGDGTVNTKQRQQKNKKTKTNSTDRNTRQLLQGFTDTSRKVTADQKLSTLEQVRLSEIPGDTVTTDPQAITTLQEEIQARNEFIETEFERNPGFVVSEEIEEFTGSEAVGNILGAPIKAGKDIQETAEQAPKIIEFASENPAKFVSSLTTPSLQRNGLSFDPSERADFEEKARNLNLVFGAAANPLSRTASSTEGLTDLAGITRQGIPGKIQEKTGESARQAVSKADPATGFGRTPRPGEETLTSRDIVSSKVDSLKNFVKGEIPAETRRRPDAREILVDEGVRMENRQKINAIVKDEKLSENADKVILDENPERKDALSQPGNVPIEVFERNRVEALEDFIGLDREELPFPGRKSKGSLELVKPETEKVERITPDPQTSEDFIDRNLRQPDRDSDSGTSFRERLRSERDERTRRSEFNRPRENLDVSTQLTSGIALTTDQDQGLTPLSDQDQSQQPLQEQPQENPVKERQKRGQDNRPLFRNDRDLERLRKKEKSDRQRNRRERDNDVGRRRVPDADFDLEFDNDVAEELNVFSQPETGETPEAAPSVDAILFGDTTDQEIEDDTVFTGFETREIDQDFKLF